MDYKQFIPKEATKLAPADHKFIEQHIVPNEVSNLSVQNPFSGVRAEVSPLVATLVALVQDLAYNDFAPHLLAKWGLTANNAVSKFDRARYIILKIDKETYYNFID